MKLSIKIENLYIKKCSTDNQLSEYILNSKYCIYDLLPIHERKHNDSFSQWLGSLWINIIIKFILMPICVSAPNEHFNYWHHIHTHTQPFHGPLGICPGLPRWAGTRKVKPETQNLSGFTGAKDSEWQWHQLAHMQICTLTCTTTPASHHSVFYRPDALPAAKPTASKHWRYNCSLTEKLKIQ